jgi:hypothetical protein
VNYREQYTPGPAYGAQIRKYGEKWTLVLVRFGTLDVERPLRSTTIFEEIGATKPRREATRVKTAKNDRQPIQ